MAAEVDQREPITEDSVTNRVTDDADLTEQAQRLGQQHRAAGAAPFGDAGYVFWDAGSARAVRDVLTTEDNAPERFRAVDPATAARQTPSSWIRTREVLWGS